MQAHFKPLCVCHLLKSHWPRQIPWQSPESGLGEVNPLPTGWGRGMAVSYYCKAQTNRDDNSVYHAGREWSRVRSGKGPRGHRLQKLRPQEGRGGAHVTQQMLGRAGHPGLYTPVTAASHPDALASSRSLPGSSQSRHARLLAALLTHQALFSHSPLAFAGHVMSPATAELAASLPAGVCSMSSLQGGLP